MKWTGNKKRINIPHKITAENPSGSKFVIRHYKKSRRFSKCLPKMEFHSETRLDSLENSINENCRSEHRSSVNLTEEERLGLKVVKVQNYWKQLSLMIPNVFRLTCLLEESTDQLLEYQDLSRKEVLAQNGGAKGKFESAETAKPECRGHLKFNAVKANFNK